MTLLAIDPGRSVKPSIGFAVFGWEWVRIIGPDVIPRREKWWSEWSRGEVTWDELCLKLNDSEHGNLRFGLDSIEEVVVENFINNPTSRGGQTNGASEVIGAVEYACARTGTLFTRQPNTILPVAKLHAGYTQKLKHLPHQDAAFLHGYYYLVERGIFTSKGLEATI